MKYALILLCAVVFCGCETTRNYSVRLESDPPGAHVFLSSSSTPKRVNKKHPGTVNGARDFLGTTPCVVSIQGDKKGYFKLPQIAYMSDYVNGSAVFTAEPPSSETNLFTQTIIFRGNTDYVGGDKIPSGVFFDMHKATP
jgi:hypothetical protein